MIGVILWNGIILMSLTSILEYIGSFVGVKRRVILAVRVGLITNSSCIADSVASMTKSRILSTWTTVLSTAAIMILGIFTEIFIYSEVV